MTVGVNFTPQMLNATDSTLNLQTAVKNIATNAVFYFTIPIAFDAVLVSGNVIDVNTLASMWKSMDDTMEVSQLVNGKFMWNAISFLSFFFCISI